MIRSALRGIALGLPPVRRLYDFAMRESGRAALAEASLANERGSNEALQFELASLRQVFHETAARAERDERRALDAEQRAIEAEHRCDALGLENYVLRSDLHRAIERNEKLSYALAAALPGRE